MEVEQGTIADARDETPCPPRARVPPGVADVDVFARRLVSCLCIVHLVILPAGCVRSFNPIPPSGDRGDVGTYRLTRVHSQHATTTTQFLLTRYPQALAGGAGAPSIHLSIAYGERRFPSFGERFLANMVFNTIPTRYRLDARAELRVEDGTGRTLREVPGQGTATLACWGYFGGVAEGFAQESYTLVPLEEHAEALAAMDAVERMLSGGSGKAPPPPPGTRIAVWPLKAQVGVEPQTMLPLTDSVRDTLVNSGQFALLARDEMERILAEQGVSISSSCDTTSCAVEYGQSLSVEKVVVGSVSRVGETYQVILRLVNVTSAREERSGKAQRAGSADVLLQLVEEAAKKLMP